MDDVEAVALELAQALGREALQIARRPPARVEAKAGLFDLVTSVDREIESHLRRRIAERFPDHAVLGEEEGLDAAGREWTWIVDPVDGTFNFATGLPACACSIALVRREEPRVAAVADLAADAVFSARAGGGLLSDRGPVAPADATGPGQARLFLDSTWEAPAPALLRGLAAFAEAAQVVPRMIGSAAVALLSVALGGGCFAGVGLRIWDVAGGLLLAEEAGRRTRRWDAGDREHVLHVLVGDDDLLDRLEPAMPALVDCWREHNDRWKEQ